MSEPTVWDDLEQVPHNSAHDLEARAIARGRQLEARCDEMTGELLGKAHAIDCLSDDRDKLRATLAQARTESDENARIIGMSGERELRLRAEVKLLQAQRDQCFETRKKADIGFHEQMAEFHKRVDQLRSDLAQARAEVAVLVEALKWYAGIGDDHDERMDRCLERAIADRPADKTTLNLGGKYIAERAVSVLSTLTESARTWIAERDQLRAEVRTLREGLESKCMCWKLGEPGVTPERAAQKCHACRTLASAPLSAAEQDRVKALEGAVEALRKERSEPCLQATILAEAALAHLDALTKTRAG